MDDFILRPALIDKMEEYVNIHNRNMSDEFSNGWDALLEIIMAQPTIENILTKLIEGDKDG